MKERINSYFAILFITIIGGGAALIIVDVATTDIVTEAFRGSEAAYAPLQKSILRN